MIDLLILAQKGAAMLWLEQNPFAGVLLITFALLALVTFIRPRWLDDSSASNDTTPASPKSFAQVMESTTTKDSAAPAQTTPPPKTQTPTTPKQKQPVSKPKIAEPEVAAPASPTEEATTPAADLSEPTEDSETASTAPATTKPLAEEPLVAEETPLAEELPTDTPSEELPTKTPAPKEIPIPVEVKDKPKDKPADKPKVDAKVDVTPVVKPDVKPADKPKDKPKDKPIDKDEELRQQKLEERQKKRTMHVSEVSFQEEKTVEPRSLRDGLERTRKGWISKLGDLLRGKKEIDDDALEDLEEILYSADIGTRTVQRLLQTIEDKLERDELNDPTKVKDAIKDEIYKILDLEKAPLDFSAEQPFVIMVVGVNGVGKTTTIGKVAARLSSEGKKVLVGAADTFRAAAVEQLELWAARTDAQVIKGQPNQDPSSVVFDAVQAGVSRKVDIVIADTAGRLHTNQNLMQELKKIKRVMARAHSSAPHEILLVLDATTGQNAINQAKEFNEALGVTGIVLTKLDGSAKGGVIVAICEELKIPIRYVGVGEHIDELKRFSPAEFVDALF